ncbi:hypothetical protein PC113_g13361 [Phytophthora cactorum]|uniref:Uncharacterized protein n=1 Tax=Phytophthora cactorum TaxID=29920 RepID=A0A8T0YXG9_9STRA|nr:hypothetical protein PC113_g13361 [Phytophthora cactorum]
MSLSHEVRVLNAESDLAWARSRPEELEKSIVADRQLKEEIDLELLDVAGAPLNLVGLSVEDVRFQVTKEDVKAGTVPVHVLVMVPDGAGGSASETSASS